MTSTRRAVALLRSVDPVRSPGSSPIPAPATESPRVRHAQPSRSTRRWLAAAAVAGVVAVGVGVGSVVTPRGASPAAAAALDSAASAADITARDEVAAPEQYWRIRTTGTYVGVRQSTDSADPDGSWLERMQRTEYVAVDGSRPSWFADSARRITRTLTGPPPVDLQTTPAWAWTTDLAPDDVPGSWQMPSPDWLAGLPRDTEQLRSRLYADTSGRGASHDAEVLVYVGDVLRSGQVPAELRAALFRVLETVPGVDVVRRHDDGLISIGRLEPRRGERSELLIDPDSGDYVGELTVQVEAVPGIPAGTVTTEVTVERVVVPAVPASLRANAARHSCTVTEGGGTSCVVP